MNKSHLEELLDAIKTESERGSHDLQVFLEGILTPSELEQMVKRLQIVKQLKKGRPQRDIAADLEVGIATVTRGAREIANGKFENV